MPDLYELLVRQIDDAVSPARMGKVEARDFLEALVTDIQSRMDALNEEMDDDQL